MPLAVYYDLMSQPARSLVMFLRLTGIPYEDKPVALRKGEQYNDEFKRVNPLSKVPCIDDNGFKLTESVTILKYIIRKCNLPEHWYPQQDLEKQARIEEYLDWHHMNTRMPTAELVRELLIYPRLSRKPVNQQNVKELKKAVTKMLSELESYFLKDKQYIMGDEISIADILAVCELTELLACHEQGLYESNPAVKAWVDRVRQRTNPHFDETHKMIYRARDNYKPMAAKL